MPIRTSITKKEYRTLVFFLIFSNTIVKIFVGICLIGLVGSTIFLVSMGTYKPDIFDWLRPILFFSIMFCSFWYSTGKAFDTNKRLSETIEFSFDSDFLIVKGESFSGQFTWDKIVKVTQTKKWVLIYQTKNAANFIAKENISESDILLLKNILAAHNVKNNL